MPDGHLLALGLILLAAIAWAAMVLATPAGGHSHGLADPGPAPTSQPESSLREGHHGTTVDVERHRAPGEVDRPATTPPATSITEATTAVGGWSVMVVAMMVPPAIPMFSMLHRLLSRRAHRFVHLGVGLLAFTIVWVLVGTTLVGADLLVDRWVGARSWVASHGPLLGGTVIAGAGLYQFTPLKNACLRACRSPRGFAVAHWRGQRPAAVETATLTTAYALSCVGCCWALMAICMVVGVAALPAMVVLALVMAGERLLPAGWSTVVERTAGLTFITVGTAVAIGWTPTGSLVG